MAILYTKVLFLHGYIYMYSSLSDHWGSWNGTLGGDLPVPLVSPSGWGPGLFGERDGCPASVATETEGSA